MTILFLSGSLEPGKDGVGDYTRALAAECTRFGHEGFLLSINDPWVDAVVAEHHLLRLGTNLPWRRRVKAARRFVTDSRPDMVSLQFVPYSFHPAGVNLELPQLLLAIVGQVPVQVMFHELWIGEQVGAPMKNRVVGFFQRKIIGGLVKSLRWRIAHTSNLTYVALLNRFGIASKHLPLFGNVPVVATEAPAHEGRLHLGMFGAIHPEWSPDELLARLVPLGKPIQLSHIGRIGPGEPLWQRLVERHGSEIELHRLGEQRLEGISAFLSALDFGISTTPRSLVGKSGCVASMLEHGLPVMVTRDDVHFRGIPVPALDSELLIPLDEMMLERLASVRRQPPKPRLPEVAKQFLDDIAA
jgi:hypothetical protein